MFAVVRSVNVLEGLCAEGLVLALILLEDGGPLSGIHHEVSSFAVPHTIHPDVLPLQGPKAMDLTKHGPNAPKG